MFSVTTIRNETLCEENSFLKVSASGILGIHGGLNC